MGEYRYYLGSDGEERLFDRARDPGEQRNLVSELPEVAALARARLEEWLRQVPEYAAPIAPQAPPDAEELENLRALGYLD